MVTSIRLLFCTLAFLQFSVFAITIGTRKFPTRSSNAISKMASSAMSSSSEVSTTENADRNDVAHNNNNNTNKWLTFSIVPASANPSNKFTRQLLEHVLPNKLHATDAKLLDEGNGGRLTFRVPAPLQHENGDTTDAPNLLEWIRLLSPCGVKSLRLVVCECSLPVTPENEHGSPHDREDFVLKTLEANLPRPELPWKIYRESFGNTPRSPSSTGNRGGQLANFDVSCRRWSSSRAISKKEFSSIRMRHSLRRLLLETYHPFNDQQTPSGSILDDCQFTLLLFDDKLRLEWTLLVPPKSKKFAETDYLPKPGCKRVEAWMLMKNLEETVLRGICEQREAILQNGNNNSEKNNVIVLDPLCGRATFLVEAATTWNMGVVDGGSVSFVGIDACDAQLRDARRNVDAVTEKGDDGNSGGESWDRNAENAGALITRRISHDQNSTIALYKGDSRDLSTLGFDDGSVVAIATCPPFGRQFFALDKGDGSDQNAGNSNHSNSNEDILAVSYRDWLREWARVLHPQIGRIVLLVDVDHQEEALEAIAATKSLHVTVVREPFRLGRVKATVIIADAMTPHNNNDDEDTTKELSSAPLARLPWEGTTKEARAEWTRLRAASLEELEPYTKVQG